MVSNDTIEFKLNKIANSSAGELGNSLCTLRDGVLGQFTGENQSDTVISRVRKRPESIRDSRAMTYEVWISRDEMVDFLL